MITPIIMVASFNAIPTETVMSYCSPTSVIDESNVKTFHDELSSIVRQEPNSMYYWQVETSMLN